MMNDGENSLSQTHVSFPGNYLAGPNMGTYAPLVSQTCPSAAMKFSINLALVGAYPPAQAVYNFGYGGYGNGASFSSGYCGSAYDFNTGDTDTFLVNFAEELYGPSSPDFPENAGP